jgi:hypothetical protein
VRAGASPLLAIAVACGSPAGGGTASGDVDGRSFDVVASAWLAGQPDDPHTTVVYVFDAPVICDDLATPGWHTRIADGTQALELKLIGLEPGDYPVPASGRPSAGESDDNLTVTSTTATPNEVSATAGSVTLDAIRPSRSATGSFDLTFPGGHLSGTFSTGFCASAHEP